MCAEAIGHTIRANLPTASPVIETALDIEAASLHPSNPFHRAQVHQASGMVALQLNISTDEALARIRVNAYARGVPITQAAADIVAQRVAVQQWNERSDDGINPGRCEFHSPMGQR
jgi:hypothetical protein